MLNTWEAVYFGLDENKILGLADKAAECGFECLVIDDGWFEGRNDDTTSLGDWYEDKSKFPHGLKELSRRLAEKGLATGQTAACRAAAARAKPDAAITSRRI